MKALQLKPPATMLHYGDIPTDAALEALSSPIIAMDLETTGLDWATDRIGVVSLFNPRTGSAYLVRPGDRPPSNIIQVLESLDVQKVFHFAAFDLAFMMRAWDLTPSNVACTKIASRILNPEEPDHTLAALTVRHLGVHLDKSSGVRTSNWLADPLSQEQVEYAGNDVKYLPMLLDALARKLHRSNRYVLAESSFAFLPTHVALLLRGLVRVFEY